MPSATPTLSKNENGRLGRVQTFIRCIDVQITEDFGEPSFSSCGSEGQQGDEISLGVRNQGVQDRSIPCITTEGYHGAVNTFQDIESGTENQFN